MIKNIMFDLGGVIMDIEKERCVAAFDRLGLRDAASFFGEYSQKGPFLRLEEGTMTVDDFHQAMRAEIDGDVTDAEIASAFCQFLIGIPAGRLADLRRLRERHAVYLLSNTNPIMWGSMIRDEFIREGCSREDYFDGMVTSFEAKALKPDEKIFRFAAQKFGIDPCETIFIDDSQSNLDAAAALGFETLHVAPGEEFADKLADMDIK